MNSNATIIVLANESGGWNVTTTYNDEYDFEMHGTLSEVIGDLLAELKEVDFTGKTTILPLPRGRRGAKIVFSGEIQSDHYCWVPSRADEHYRLLLANRFRGTSISAHEAYCHNHNWELTDRSQMSLDIESLLDWRNHSDCANCRAALRHMVQSAYWTLAHQLMDIANGIASQLVADTPVAIAWQSNVRDLIEIAGKSIWMTDPLYGRDPKFQVCTRLARLFLEEFKSVSESDRYPNYFDSQEDHLFRHYADRLGFDLSSNEAGEVVGIKIGEIVDERRPASSKFVGYISKEVIADTDWTNEDWEALYARGSAVTHGRFFALRRFRSASEVSQTIESLGILGPALAGFQIALNRIGWISQGSIATRGVADYHRELRSTYLDLLASLRGIEECPSSRSV